MKETYESMDIEIRELPVEDVITASEIVMFSEHDNAFFSFRSFE